MIHIFFHIYLVSIYLFKINNGNTQSLWQIYSKLTKKAPERHRWRCSGVFINFEKTSHTVVVFLLMTFNPLMPGGNKKATNT